MSGYDSVSRNVFGADGRQRRCRRNLRWQAVLHLRASDRKCSAANSGTVNRRLNEAVAAGRAKSSATWKVSNVSERAKVRRYTAVEDLVHQDGNYKGDALRNTLPVKAHECIRDMDSLLGYSLSELKCYLLYICSRPTGVCCELIWFGYR